MISETFRHSATGGGSGGGIKWKERKAVAIVNETTEIKRARTEGETDGGREKRKQVS